MDFLAGLNPQQREAVAHTEGPLLILAGAGSGKTRVITHRIGHLIKTKGVYPSAILAVTFTNKASGEMRDRVAKILKEPDPNRLPRVSTFHSFSVRTLRRDGAKLAEIRPNFTTAFNIYDDDDQLSLIKGIFKNLGLDEKFMQYRAALSRISAAKSAKETPADFYKQTADPRMGKLAVIYEQYESRLHQANALDFDDLLLETVRLLSYDTDLRQRYNQYLEYLMIDEYQDTNRTQYELMRLLSSQRGNVAVVGDEDQSIYSWRGADIRNILDFENDYPNAAVIRLEQNYRSTKNILDAAGAVVENNLQRKGKRLWTDSGSGDKIALYEAVDGENEALYIADQINKALGENPHDRAAVLYRTNFQSRQIEEALRRYGRPYVVVGGFSFYQRAEVKDLLSYLKAVQSPDDSIALQRIINVPARGIGKTTLEQIEQFAASQKLPAFQALERMIQQKEFGARAESALRAFRDIMHRLREVAARGDVGETMRTIAEDSGYLAMLKSDPSPDAETRLENIEELLNAAAESAERGESIADFLDHAALVADSDQLDSEARISLLTIHNSKGLEFPLVYLAGMEEGLFPHQRSLTDTNSMEEERRLCYVAMTRAEKRLSISYARMRRRFGGGPAEPTLPSRFLKEIPQELVDHKGGLRSRFQDNDMDDAALGLYGERHEVRESARRNLYTGKTYNSVENVRGFFEQRGITVPAPPPPSTPPPAQPQAAPPPAAKPAVPPMRQTAPPPLPRPSQQQPSLFGGPPKQQAARPQPGSLAYGGPPKQQPVKRPGSQHVGSVVQHPKYGRGTVLRQEGDGDDAKLTISFPGYGLKKLIAKLAGLKS
ncbi:MAG TPA: UvrD-helicase domain-containing protein [Bryobacteraceae bacterium]|nr:UvrD-helicase domain-containing protein [Bryobacteraceae bacterium]